MRANCVVLRYITKLPHLSKRSDLQTIILPSAIPIPRSALHYEVTRVLANSTQRAATAFQNNSEGEMALMDDALNTASVVYSDGLSERSSCYDYCPSSVECSPEHSRSLDHSNRLIMNDKDKGIYNSLGSSSSPHGKLTCSELGLQKGWKKRGIMFKTGPKPSWYTPWRRRVFVLKDNFLYYCRPTQKLNDAPVLGAIYLKNAIVEKTSLPFAKRVLKITPPVPRRRGWEDDEESCVFHIRFQTEEGRNEWFEELQQVSFEHQYPSQKEAFITTSMEFTRSKLTPKIS